MASPIVGPEGLRGVYRRPGGGRAVILLPSCQRYASSWDTRNVLAGTRWTEDVIYVSSQLIT